MYVQTGYVHMDNASLHVLHHALALVVVDKVLHYVWCDGRQLVTQDVGLQALKECALRNGVKAKPLVDLVKENVTGEKKGAR